MATVHIRPDCGNAPRKLLLRDFTIALADNNHAFILNWLADDIQWELVGDRLVSGRTAVTGMLRDTAQTAVDEVTVANIITHGDAGSVNGTVQYADGRRFGFCSVYTFAGHSKTAKIKVIAAYRIETTKD